MDQYVGLDVSLEETSVCIIDGTGRILREGKVASDVEAIAAYVSRHAPSAVHVGFETGQLSPWLWHGLREAGLPAVCVCARHAKAFLKAQLNKTDRNDARGLAQLMRFGAYKEVHVKQRQTHVARAALTGRALLVKQRRDLENQLRGLLKTFGLKLGKVSGGAFETRVRALVEGDAALLAALEPLLMVRIALRRQIAALDSRLRSEARRDPVCRLLMTADGVGAIVALSYRHTIEDARRFRHAANAGAYVGLTPRRFSSGEVDYTGRISKFGDAMLRGLLFEAANVLLTRCRKPCALKAWGLRLAARRGRRRATVAVARKLAVILHRMWIDGTPFRRTAQAV